MRDSELDQAQFAEKLPGEYGEVNGVGWSSCERCPRVFVRGTHLEAYSAKVEHWIAYH